MEELAEAPPNPSVVFLRRHLSGLLVLNQKLALAAAQHDNKTQADWRSCTAGILSKRVLCLPHEDTRHELWMAHRRAQNDDTLTIC